MGGRLRPERVNHVWSYDFVEDRTHDHRKYRMLNVIDEFTHECLAIRINRKLKAIDVIDVLSDLFILRGIPDHISVPTTSYVGRRGVRKGNRPPFTDRGQCLLFKLIQAASAVKEEALGHSEHRVLNA